MAHTSAFTQYFKTGARLSYNDILRHNHRWSSYLDNINFVWIDLPSGKHIHETKLSAFEQVMSDIHQICKARKIAMAILMPCQHKNNSVKISRSRWAKIVESWNPFQRTFCTCRIIPFAHFRGGDIHYKFRMLCSNVVFKATDCGCSLRECSSAHLPKKLSTLLVGSLFRLGHFDFSSEHNLFRVSQGGAASVRKTVNVEILRQASEMEGEVTPVKDRLISTQFAARPTSPTHSPTSCRHDRTFAPHAILPVHKLMCAQELPDSTGHPGDQSHSTKNDVKAFPTDSKERQTAQKRKDKEAGVVREVKKLKKFVEDHNDDCGEDLRRLGNLDMPSLLIEESNDAELNHSVAESNEADSDLSDDEEQLFHNLQLDFFVGR